MDRKDPVTLSQREQQRLHVLTEVEAGRWTAAQGAEVLGLSLRHVWRLRGRYRQEGAAAFMHGNRGRPSPGRIDDMTRSRVKELLSGPYAGCNDHSLAELLALREGIVLSRKSVERIRREAGLKPTRQRRPPKHRQRRERMSQERSLPAPSSWPSTMLPARSWQACSASRRTLRVSYSCCGRC